MSRNLLCWCYAITASWCTCTCAGEMGLHMTSVCVQCSWSHQNWPKLDLEQFSIDSVRIWGYYSAEKKLGLLNCPGAPLGGTVSLYFQRIVLRRLRGQREIGRSIFHRYRTLCPWQCCLNCSQTQDASECCLGIGNWELAGLVSKVKSMP